MTVTSRTNRAPQCPVLGVLGVEGRARSAGPPARRPARGPGPAPELGGVAAPDDETDDLAPVVVLEVVFDLAPVVVLEVILQHRCGCSSGTSPAR